ncbi:NHLP leader peptide family natural product precursor [Candidatus Methylospira mobilis]|uniref:NHLP leader peptide family natural product n=1 Tax=Candidatus Methylospira mobilis TaxID=1808979 RepID=A0A5Q0BH86_9GAMM|nr:NHLP leader peptide family RiPP precursor [Candidatus Methylospira mobilis]QFY43235.1 NHLP leader peptide family natural product precursor [Candidatus Methylospira mobilis]
MINQLKSEDKAQLDEHGQQFHRLILKCWADEAFKAKLFANAKETLKEEGVDISDDINVKVLENTDSLHYLVIPENVTDISDEELDDIVGGRLKYAWMMKRGIFSLARVTQRAQAMKSANILKNAVKIGGALGLGGGLVGGGAYLSKK